MPPRRVNRLGAREARQHRAGGIVRTTGPGVLSVRTNEQLAALKRKLLRKFYKTLSDELNPTAMKCVPMSIKLQADTVPVCVTTARRVPKHLLQNQRLMCMREKLTNYNFSVIWTPGKGHHIANALSRAPVFGPCDLNFEPEHLERCLRIFDSSLMKMDASEDARYTETIAFIKSGKHISSIDRSSGLCIETYREEEVLVLDSCKLVVPTHKSKAILRLLHAGHSGVKKNVKDSDPTILLTKHEKRY